MSEIPAHLRKLGSESDSIETTANQIVDFLHDSLVTDDGKPAWNNRKASQSHSIIPLVDEESIRAIPMIARLFDQLGLDIALFVEKETLPGLEINQNNFNIFYVPEAKGSPYIPAQHDFVVPYNIRSLVGFGGLLPSGNLFATILFLRTPISESAAMIFRTVSLSVKMALLGSDGRKVYQ
ncbi:MAG: hypothetical protein JKX97_02495 [Candidatus Lindowbacteria bacterium]|nr:hypothetical protein [Candidatus Lindowbacteria bacterium]